MALHGHTKIELTNVKTGEVKSYEKDNRITNALTHLVNDYEYLQMSTRCGFDYGENTAIFSAGSTLKDDAPEGADMKYIANNPSYLNSNFIAWAINGVKLFSCTIDESANHLYPNSSEYKSIVGYASSNSTDYTKDTLRGVMNSSETGITSTGNQFVWEFDTNKANGEIKCVCLTDSLFGGREKAGTAMSLCRNDDPYIYYDSSSDIHKWIDQPFKFPCEYDNGVLTCICYTNGQEHLSSSTDNIYADSITIRKYRLNTSIHRLNGDDIYKPKLINTQIASITANRYVADDYSGQCVCSDETNYYIVASNGSHTYKQYYPYYYILIINKETLEVSELPITGDLQTRGSSYGSSQPYCTYNSDSCVYKDSYIYIVNGSTGNVCKVSTIDGSSKELGTFKPEYGFYYNGSYTWTKELGPTMFVENDVIHTAFGVILNDDTLIDTVSVATPSNGGSTGVGYSYAYSPLMGTTLSNCCLRDSGRIIFPVITTSFKYRHNRIEFHPIMQLGFLATINNLDETITKTSDQTMKITYTLTWSDD